jgi:hypothetical protein
MTEITRQEADERVGTGPFEEAKEPWRFGVLYTKTWRAPLVHGLTDIWRERCRQYWMSVERRFGVIFSERRDAYDEYTETITTMATLLVILPAERYPARQSEEVH